jgi:hypothetical protein
VTADPVPDHRIFLHNRERPIAEADANRIDAVLTFQLLELQARMGSIALELPIGAFCLLLNVEREVGK